MVSISTSIVENQTIPRFQSETLIHFTSSVNLFLNLSTSLYPQYVDKELGIDTYPNLVLMWNGKSDNFQLNLSFKDENERSRIFITLSEQPLPKH